MAGPAGYKHEPGIEKTVQMSVFFKRSASQDEQARKNAQMGCFIMSGWTGRIRTCECWDQNPVPYRLATVQSSVILAQEDKTVEQRKAAPKRAAIIFIMNYNLRASGLSVQ